MSIIQNGELTPRESVLHEWEIENFAKQAEHEITMKKLELEIKKLDNEAKIELKRLDQKWKNLLKLPKLLILLPVYIILAFAYIVAVIRKHEPTKSYWDLLN